VRYKWNLERLSGWQIILLENMGLPLEFSLDQLTTEQYEKLQFVIILKELAEKGLVKPEYRDGNVTFSVTKKGEEFLKRHGRI
jgi:hypothetical protein